MSDHSREFQEKYGVSSEEATRMLRDRMRDRDRENFGRTLNALFARAEAVANRNRTRVETFQEYITIMSISHRIDTLLSESLDDAIEYGWRKLNSLKEAVKALEDKAERLGI